jgi:hypothetical protein
MPMLSESSIYWFWQAEPSEDATAEEVTEAAGEPTCLEGFDREGRLIVRWYVRGGQVRERALLDPNEIARFRV